MREELLKQWLAGLREFSLEPTTLQPASSDASFRRYLRIQAGERTLVVMDAPPPMEDIRPFLDINNRLRNAGFHAPDILAFDAEHGFVLMEDLGCETFYDSVSRATRPVEHTYRAALDLLATMQSAVQTQGMTAYGAEKLRQEMDLFDEWFVGHHFQATLTAAEKAGLDRIKAMLVTSALSEGQVFVHRDYHCRNLMVCSPKEANDFDFGIIDHQDAVVGPVSYDVVSLLRDAYVEWPEDETLDWAIRFWQKAKSLGVPVPDDVTEFYRQIDFMGLQRHLKVLGIFARLNYRDGKSQYMKDLKLVTAYVRITAGRYDAFKPLLALLDRLEFGGQQVGYTF